jgi:hypothetical protein
MVDAVFRTALMGVDRKTVRLYLQVAQGNGGWLARAVQDS